MTITFIIIMYYLLTNKQQVIGMLCSDPLMVKEEWENGRHFFALYFYTLHINGQNLLIFCVFELFLFSILT